MRACAAHGIAALDKTSPAKVVGREWSRDEAADWLVRSATVPLDTGSAPGLVRQVVADLVSTLASQSAAARLFANGLRLSFDGAGSIVVPTLQGDASYAAFVGENGPIPVMQGKTDPLIAMVPRKLATLVVASYAMLKSSNIEALLLDMLTRSVALALDTTLFDGNPDDGTRPAGIRCGIAALVASTAPDAMDALMNDVEALSEAVEPVTTTQASFIMSPTRAMMAQIRSAHRLDPMKVFGSGGLQGSKDIIAITPNVIASVLDGVPEIVTAMHAAPLMDTAGTTVKSMWQSDCVAILVRLPVSWAVRSPAGVAWLTPTNW